MSKAAYHRAGHERRVLAVLELVVAVVVWFLLTGVLFAVVLRIAGVRKFRLLPPRLHAIALLAGLAMLLPAALLAALATRRPVGRLSSVRGRVRWRWLATCLGAALAVRGLPLALGLLGVTLNHHFAGWAEFLPQLAVVLVVVPLQAAGEEYFFRGTLMQSVGSFTRSAWPPAIVTTAAFTAAHGFRPELLIAIGSVGACSAWLTLRTGGLEAALGHHIVLNVGGMALTSATTGLKPNPNQNVHWFGVVMSVATVAIYTAVIARLAKRRLPAVDEPSVPAAEPTEAPTPATPAPDPAPGP